MSSVVILFIILGVLSAIEASTSISRKAGYCIDNPSTGFVFQSSLSLVSRALMFMFMPLLGYLADKNNLFHSNVELVLLYAFIPLFLFLSYIFRFKIEYLYAIFLLRMDKVGSFFKKTDITSLNIINFKLKKHFKRYKKFKKMYIIFLFSYIPYYASWSIIIYLLAEFNESRGMILGLSSVFNGINTIVITLFIDPKLTQLGRYNRLIQYIYNDLVLLRFYASIIGIFVLVIFIGILNAYI